MVGPEVRGECQVELVEGRSPQGLDVRAGRAREHRLPRNPLHSRLTPLLIRVEAEPGKSLGLRGGDRKGILASGHVHLYYPQDVRILRGRRRGCVRLLLDVYQELELQKLVGESLQGGLSIRPIVAVPVGRGASAEILLRQWKEKLEILINN